MNNTIICTSLGFTINIILSFLLFYKSRKEHSRIIFGFFTAFFALNSIYYILRNGQVHIDNGDPFSYAVLSMGALVTALFLILPLEFMLPSGLKKRWVVPILFIPEILINVLWVTLRKSGMSITHLRDSSVLFSYLNDASVILRLVFFYLILLFFLSSIVFMIWAHKRYMTQKILRIYAYATIPIMLIYINIVYYGLTETLYNISSLYILLFNTVISYFLIYPSDDIETGKSSQSVETEIVGNGKVNSEMKIYELQLLHQLDELMEREKLYRSSELSLPNLARMLGTNRTKLSEIIHYKGYTNFSAYLNSYRMREFVHIISTGDTDKISDVAALAGFGSKASLYRCFISTYGVSPSEYLKNREET